MTTYSSLSEFIAAVSEKIRAGASLEDLRGDWEGLAPEARVDTSPRALAALVEQTWGWAPFLAVRFAEVFDGAQVTHDDTYVMVFVNGIGDRVNEPSLRAAYLRIDEELRDEVFWRIFEVERVDAVSLASLDRHLPPNGSWKRALGQLVADGVVDRARVLRSCLAALGRDFSDFTAGWYSAAYVALEPTPAEAQADQDLLLNLVASPTKATAALATKQLAAVQKAGGLDVERFVAVAPDALVGPKGTATTTVRILAAVQRAARKDSSIDLGAAQEALAAGLTNVDASVQAATAKALVAGDRGDLIAAHAAVLAPAVAQEYAGHLDADPQAAAAPEEPVAERPAALRLEPWTDAEAAARLAALLSGVNRLGEVETSWAWLVSSGERAAVCASLEKRVRKLLDGRSRTTQADVVATVLAAGNIEAELPGWLAGGIEKDRSFRAARWREVCGALETGEQRILLATPSDTHGWVAPATLVQRVLAQGDAQPLHHDVIGGLLRLGAEGREQALAELRAAAPGTEIAAVLAYALGATAEVPDAPTSAWWVAAARVRDPLGVAELPDPPGWPGRGPGLDEPLRLDVTYEQINDRHWYAHVAAHPVEAGDEGPLRAVDLPTVLPSGLSTDYDDVEFAAWLYPASTIPLVPPAIADLKPGTETGFSARPTAALALELLAEHPGAWVAATVHPVALAMTVGDAGLRVLGGELLVEAVPDRLEVAEAVAGFRATAGLATLNRWATALTDASAISASAERTVRELLTGLLPALDPARKGVAQLLALLLDLSLRAGAQRDDAELRTWLGGFTGSGAAAKSAKALLALA